MGEKRGFTREFKKRAVKLTLKTDRKQSEITHQLCINGNRLAQWKREVKQGKTGPMKAFTGRGKARDEEVSRLRKENADLWKTHEILNTVFVHLHDTKSSVATYLFMRQDQGQYTGTKMAREFGVNRRWWYAWFLRKPSRHEQVDWELLRLIIRIFELHQRRYESLRVADLTSGVSPEDKPKASGTADEGGGTDGLEEEAMGKHDGLTAFTAGSGEPVASGIYRLRARREVGVGHNVSEE
jgi:transposase